MNHPSYHSELEEQIDRYISGSLNREEIERLWEKLMEQPYYLDYMKTCVSLREIGRQAAGDKRVEEPLTAYRFNFRHAIAAGLIMLVAVLGVLNVYPGSRSYAPEPLATLEMNNLRSAALSDSEFERELQKAIHLAVLGREDQAFGILDHLKETAQSEELKLDVLINIGIIHYNRADYAPAKEAFITVAQNHHGGPLVKERAWWYLANSYLQTNHREDAKVAVQHVYDVNGAYRRMAARWLEGW